MVSVGAHTTHSWISEVCMQTGAKRGWQELSFYQCADAMCFPTLSYSHATSCYPTGVENC
eukprot:240722-Pelagomonas_calceolata.AAC.2